MSVGDDFSYHYQRFFVPFSWYGRRFARGLYRRMVRTQDAADVRRFLTALGFTHLVVYPDERTLWRGRERNAWVTREAFWEEELRLEYAAGGVYLFALTGPAGARTRGPALLDEPSAFETGADRPPLGAVVEAGKLYALEAFIRSTVSEARGGMAIHWYSAAGRAIGTATARSIRVPIEWRRHAVAATAPPGAQRAIITLSATGDRPIEARNVLFYELR